MRLPLEINAVFPFGFFAIFAITSSLADSSCSPKACSRETQTEKPVCGSDGLTYPNRCLFERARCLNRNMTLTKRSGCRTQRPCNEWETIASSANYSFKAKCKTDGAYESAQCIREIGFCWCVTPEGVPLPYTSMRRKPEAKPRCGRKKSTRRRSPRRNNRSRPCKQRDKAIFNNNLMNNFQTEFHRYTGQRTLNDSHVLEWKFNSLDNNNDHFLDKLEYRDLKRLAKKAVKPKRCAKSFTRSCDLDGDFRISWPEWAECLTRDGLDDGRGGGGEQNASSDPADGDQEEEEYELPFGAPRSPPDGILLPGLSNPDRSLEDESPEIRDDDPTDCISDRTAALHEEDPLYVPECTPDGRYQKVQCYKIAGYCWCVHEDTGKNIPGTSVKNGTPTCDNLTPISRPMKGCPEEKKNVFLRDLSQYLQTQIPNNTSTFNGLDYIASKEERAAKWSFVVFDKNKNKMLDKIEWKAFKDKVGGVKGLKKCGKKLPRYCDINKDRSISLTEWLECLNVQQGSAAGGTLTNTAKGKKTLNMLMED
ncbi:unnamed protein product [Brassicogethes aeneus]|uniref:SPARC-related modular calcium-binding protein 2 n=1 Tax=Brassicogethes aeneus TaxID=1431903 RepID=A0A9P0FAP8_BRAAE|nr:unnamed protein product [Brassicogethes aeneus]